MENTGHILRKSSLEDPKLGKENTTTTKHKTSEQRQKLRILLSKGKRKKLRPVNREAVLSGGGIGELKCVLQLET